MWKPASSLTPRNLHIRPLYSQYFSTKIHSNFNSSARDSCDTQINKISCLQTHTATFKCKIKIPCMLSMEPAKTSPLPPCPTHNVRKERNESIVKIFNFYCHNSVAMYRLSASNFINRKESNERLKKDIE